jgi:hypothetical protein
MDAAGNVITTGWSDNHAFTAKYASADGALLWQKSYPEAGPGTGFAYHVAVDSAGNVVIAGNSSGIFAAKYAATDGALLWEAHTSGTMSEMYPYSNKLALTPDGGAVVTGGASSNYTTIRLTPPPTTFAQWKLARLGDAAALDNGDPELDGLPSILEYTLGTDPLSRTSQPVAGTASNQTTLTFPRITTVTDATLTVQGSDDLAIWTDLASSINGAPMTALVVGVIVNETGPGPLRTVEVRDLYTLGDPAHPQRFLRLSATPSPAPAAPAPKPGRATTQHRHR